MQEITREEAMPEPTLTEVLQVLREDLDEMIHHRQEKMSTELSTGYERRISCYRAAIAYLEAHASGASATQSVQ